MYRCVMWTPCIKGLTLDELSFHAGYELTDNWFLSINTIRSLFRTLRMFVLIVYCYNLTKVLRLTCDKRELYHFLTKLSFLDGESSKRKFHMPSKWRKDRLSESLGYNIPSGFFPSEGKQRFENIWKHEKTVNRIDISMFASYACIYTKCDINVLCIRLKIMLSNCYT